MADLSNTLNIILQAQDNATGAIKEVVGSLGDLVIPGLAAAGALAGIGVAAKAGLADVEEFGNATLRMMRETGQTAEQASTLITVFERFGVSSDEASRALGIFEKHLAGVESQAGLTTNKGKGFGQTMQDLGIQVDDASGKVRPLNDVLLDVADKFQAMPDGIDKTALAMQMFGRGGKDMILMLDQGRAGLEEAMQAANEYGLSLSGDNIAAIKEYKYAHIDLEEAMKGVRLQIGVALMPAMASLAEIAAHLAEGFNQLVLPAIQAFGSWLGENVIPVLQVFAGVITTEVGPPLMTLGGAILPALNAAWAEVAPAIAPALEGLIDFATTVADMATAAFDWGVNIVDSLAGGIAAAAGEVADALSGIGDMIAGLLMPGSPPRLLPDLDVWGTSAAQVYLDAWAKADPSSLQGLASPMQQALKHIENELAAEQDKAKLARLDATIANPLTSEHDRRVAELEEQKIKLQELIAVEQEHAQPRTGGGGAAGGQSAAQREKEAATKAEWDYQLATATSTEKVALLEAALAKAAVGTRDYWNLNKELAAAEANVAKEQEAAAKKQEEASRKVADEQKRLATAQMDAALAAADNAGKVAIYQDALNKATPGTVEYYDLQRKLTDAQHAAAAAGASLASATDTAAKAGENHAQKAAQLRSELDKLVPGTKAYEQTLAQLKTEEAAAAAAAAAHAGHLSHLAAGHHAAAGGAAAHHAATAGHAAMHAAAGGAAGHHAAALHGLAGAHHAAGAAAGVHHGSLAGLTTALKAQERAAADAAKAEWDYNFAIAPLPEKIQMLHDKLDKLNPSQAEYWRIKKELVPLERDYAKEVAASTKAHTDAAGPIDDHKKKLDELKDKFVDTGLKMHEFGSHMSADYNTLATDVFPKLQNMGLLLKMTADTSTASRTTMVGDNLQTRNSYGELESTIDVHTGKIMVSNTAMKDNTGTAMQQIRNDVRLVKEGWALYTHDVGVNIDTLKTSLATGGLNVIAYGLTVKDEITAAGKQWATYKADVVANFNAIKKDMDSRVAEWQAVGTEWVNGLIAGMESAWGNLSDWVNRHTGGLIGTAKQASRTNSPSQQWADELGAPMVQGIQQGMTAATPALLTTIQQLGLSSVQAITDTLALRNPTTSLYHTLGQYTMFDLMDGINFRQSDLEGTAKHNAIVARDAFDGELNGHATEAIGSGAVLRLASGIRSQAGAAHSAAEAIVAAINSAWKDIQAPHIPSPTGGGGGGGGGSTAAGGSVDARSVTLHVHNPPNTNSTIADFKLASALVGLP